MINFIDEDTQVDMIIKNGINHFYMHDLAKISKNVQTGMIMPVMGLAKLPDDCLSVISIQPELNDDDYIIEGSDTIKTSHTELLTVIYNAFREPLSADTDIPEVNRKYWYPMALYGCYAYYMHRKKEVEAREYFVFLQTELSAVEDKHQLTHKIKDNISSIAGGDLY
jgi:hypothetical protein